MTKKRIIIIGAVVVVIGAALYFRGGDKQSVEYTTTPVVRQDLTQTVSATGQIKSAEEIELNFAASGRITGMTAVVGQPVTARQVLARLDAGDLAVQLRQYQATLASAQANLQKVLDGATEPELQVAESQVENAAAAYNAALTSLHNTQKDRDENMTIYRDTALNDIRNYLFKARASLDVIQTVYNDPAGKDYISIKNPQYLINTKVQREDALTILSASDQVLVNAKASGDQQQILAALNNVKLSLNQVALALDSMYNALLASITSASFPEASLDTLKTTIRTEQTTISTGINTLQTDASNLQTKRLYYDNAVASAEDTLEIKQQAWDLAKAQYAVTAADPKKSDVAYYSALVDQAAAQVAAIQQKMSDRVITAPVAGVVTKVNNSIGEYASLTTPVVVMLGDQQFEIEVDVPESDIAKISVGDEAKVTLDAFGDEALFTGHIILIEPAETEISGVVYYKVKVNIDETEYDIKPGMTANVDVLTDSRTGVLVIPQRAVVEGKVQVLTDAEANQVADRAVQTGLKGDDGLVEVVSGLSEGENVVTFVKNGSK
ncbi:efflux RND transporter periplasmic adaptor subunit [Candidatus Falkowbacteria bacterium]|nr:efflux RND transporter periplasmic adaptor subunit [Candidatus Falkowbacteria bacterium]